MSSPAMDEREQRIGRNEALFRRVNEAVEEVAEARSEPPDEFAIVCECGAQDCTQEITLHRVEYEAIRADPTHFIVKPGHEVRSVERAISRGDRYWVIAKHEGPPSDLARELSDRER